MKRLHRQLERTLQDYYTYREDCVLGLHACKSSDAQRRVEEPQRGEIRPAFFHDTDRIIHSLAYTRYIDKTQVFYLFRNDHITHRVLHVQFVSKIARAIGRALRLNEDLIEAIALGHDIGHPPFGHEGEQVLDCICRERGLSGYDHSVQSVRFLSMCTEKGKRYNLTLQVLDGILCHDGESHNQCLIPDRKKNWKRFDEEMIEKERAPRFSKKPFCPTPMTLEGCVMRFADTISYIGRDIDDAISIGLIKRKDMPSKIVSVLGTTNGQIINTLVNDLIEQSYGKGYIAYSKKISQALYALKYQFNYPRIYNNPLIKERGKIEYMYRMMFEHFMKELIDNKPSSYVLSFLQATTQQYRKKVSPPGLVRDFLSRMTDRFFISLFKRLILPIPFGVKIEDGSL